MIVSHINYKLAAVCILSAVCLQTAVSISW